MSTPSARTALDGLAELVSTPLDRNDLGRLARMHSFCQALLSASEPSQPGAREAVRTLAQGLATLLEKVILDEAARPADGLALVPEAAQMLSRAAAGQPVPAEQLRARLMACATGEEPAPRAPASDTQPATRAPSQPPVCETAAPSQPDRSPAPSAPSETVPSQPDEPSEASGQGEAYVSEPLVIDLNETEHLRGFIDESREHMDAIEAALLAVEKDPTDPARINELFRPFHTIKGIAGFLNLRDINCLAHEVETILDLGRKGELPLTAATVDRIFSAVDALKAQVAAIATFLANPQGDVCPQPDVSRLIGELRAIASGGTAQARKPRPKLGEILVANEAATPQEVSEALQVQSRATPTRKLGEILVTQGAVSHKQVDNALCQQATGKVQVAEQSIRVETAKLDALVDAVGELVIAQTMVNLNDLVHRDEKLSRDVSQVSKIVRDVQETAMAMRMVPIGATFQKMRRLVRDVARKADKLVELHISGEDTELDKTVVQQISDPLVHMVRNAVDHGIESPEARRAAGKPETGNVYLDAYHQGDSIVIEVRDDGHGLNRERLVAKALERGMLTAEEAEQASDQQVYALIMQPGFSTAEKVTDISGRGVGMDVVRRNIEALRGKVEISSEAGRGTKFVIRLPLTLAIIDGMLVRVGQERLIIPTILIEQSLRPQPSQITTVQRRGEMLQVRGELCPLIQLGQVFGYCPRIDPCQALVVIVHSEGQKLGLVVEELIGQQQVVIKSLARSFKRVHGVSGAAILGDGRVGLILEPAGLLRLHNSYRQQSIAYRTTRAADAADSSAAQIAAGRPAGAAQSSAEPNQAGFGPDQEVEAGSQDTAEAVGQCSAATALT